MSLKLFHIVFIVASSLLSLVFGGWAVRSFAAGGGALDLIMGLVSIAFGLALVAYLSWFRRKIRTRDEEDQRRRETIRPLAVLVLVWLAGHGESLACSVCYGEAEGPIIDGARIGVFALFGLVLSMQVAFGTFFLSLRRRARRSEHDREATDGASHDERPR